MHTTAIGSLEYKNDFFSLVIRETEHRPGSYIFSMGHQPPQVQPHHLGKDRDLLERRIQGPATASS